MGRRGAATVGSRTVVGAGHVQAGAGQRVWFLGNLMTIKHGLGADDTMTVIDGELRAGHAPPLHFHEHEVESFYVLSGTVRFRHGREEFDAGPHDYVTVPSGPRTRSGSAPAVHGC
jgi:mannose-6-phosphate isomerase-like protein (cupin superfamily)